MPILTENRRKVLQAMLQDGAVIREFPGFGNRMKPTATLMTAPLIQADGKAYPHPFAREETNIRYSDFNAIVALMAIERYHTDWSMNYWRLNRNGFLILQRAEDKDKGFK